MQEAQVEQTETALPQIALTLSVEEVNKVLAALAKLPLESVVDLFFKIRNEAAAQIQPAGETK